MSSVAGQYNNSHIATKKCQASKEYVTRVDSYYFTNSLADINTQSWHYDRIAHKCVHELPQIKNVEKELDWIFRLTDHDLQAIALGQYIKINCPRIVLLKNPISTLDQIFTHLNNSKLPYTHELVRCYSTILSLTYEIKFFLHAITTITNLNMRTQVFMYYREINKFKKDFNSSDYHNAIIVLWNDIISSHDTLIDVNIIRYLVRIWVNYQLLPREYIVAYIRQYISVKSDKSKLVAKGDDALKQIRPHLRRIVADILIPSFKQHPSEEYQDAVQLLLDLSKVPVKILEPIRVDRYTLYTHHPYDDVLEI